MNNRPVILTTRLGADIFIGEPHQCKCGHVTQLFHSFEGRTYCDVCLPRQEAA